MDWVERCFALATIIGGIVFVAGLTWLALLKLGTNAPDKSLAVASGCIAPKPQPGVGGPGLAVGRGRFLTALVAALQQLTTNESGRQLRRPYFF